MFATLLLALLPSAAPQQDPPSYAEVHAEKAILHAFYDRKSAPVLELESGLPVMVVAELAPWSKVRVPGGLDVWVHEDYVVWKDGVGKISKEKVRIRPRPSTQASSTPLGHFSKGDVVIRLGQEGEWLHVRAPETIAAWILSKNLSVPKRSTVEWQRLWKNAQAARKVVPVREGKRVSNVAVNAEGANPRALVEAAAIAEASVPTNSSAGKGVALDDAGPLFSSTEVAKNPAFMSAQASARLEQLATAVARDSGAWNRRRLDNLEMVFGNVIWHSADLQTINAARSSLTRIDGLRKFYFSTLSSAIRRAVSAKQPEQVVALQQRLEAEKQPVPPMNEGTSVEIGWVEYRPSVNANMPFRLVRGDRQILMHSFDGHQNLRELVNREIVVRGVWRQQTTNRVRVLAITELRVLPPRNP